MTTAPAQPRKFTFDTEFDGDRVIAPIKPKLVFTAEEVDAARAQGFAEGQRSITARAEAETAAALADVTRAIRAAMSGLTRLAHDHRTASAELAMAAAGKIADAALDRFPEAPVQATLQALARELEGQPRLIVRLAKAEAQRLEPALAKAAESAGFVGQVLVKTDPDLPRAAFVFDWGDGRAAFDPQDASARIGEALATALAAEGLHAEPPPTGET